MTSPHEVEQSRTILKTVTAGEHVSNIRVSTICNSVNVNNIKHSIASSTFAVKPVINSVKFNNIVNAPNVAEPLSFPILILQISQKMNLFTLT